MPAPGEPPPGLPHEPTGASQPRALRALVPFEVVAIVALAIVPLPDALPVALPLLIVAILSRWGRRRDWNELIARCGRARGAAGHRLRCASYWVVL